MGNALRRFQAIQDENSVFRFQIDTTKIDPLATDGSENPLTFKIPLNTASSGNQFTTCIIKVSDGRPDISINGNSESLSKSLLTFATPGIYDLEIYGYVQTFGFYNTFGYDRKKIVLISNWGKNVKYELRAFNGCSNLVIDANNVLKLSATPSWFFQGIKEIRSNLNLIDTSAATDMGLFLSGITMPIASTLNPFFNSLTIVAGLYQNVTFSPAINKLEIIGNAITSLNSPWNGITFQTSGDVDLIVHTPNLTQMFRVFFSGNIRTKCHAGNIDVRNVTDTNQWLNGTFSKAQVDATLLGWANLPFMQSGVTWNWNGSKYSNDLAVIAAYNKITSDWGVIFTNLTME